MKLLKTQPFIFCEDYNRTLTSLRKSLIRFEILITANTSIPMKCCNTRSRAGCQDELSGLKFQIVMHDPQPGPPQLSAAEAKKQSRCSARGLD